MLISSWKRKLKKMIADINILKNNRPLKWLGAQTGGKWLWGLCYDYLIGDGDNGGVILPRLNAGLEVAGYTLAEYNDCGLEITRKEYGDTSLPFGWHLVSGDTEDVLIFDHELTAMLASVKMQAVCIAVTSRPSEEAIRLLATKRCVALPATADALENFQNWLGSIPVSPKFTDGNICNDILTWLTSLPNQPLVQRRRIETDEEIIGRLAVEIRQKEIDTTAILRLQSLLGGGNG